MERCVRPDPTIYLALCRADRSRPGLAVRRYAPTTGEAGSSKAQTLRKRSTPMVEKAGNQEQRLT